MFFNFLLGCIILFSIIYGLQKLFNKIRTQNTSTEVQSDSITNTSNWNECYEPTNLMTQNEKAQFQKLMNWAHENHYYVFAKVRLADLIKPRNNNQKLFWKIQAKHVDFVICDGNIKPKLVIELQDSSHMERSRKERDAFVKEVLESCGYKSLWIFNIEKEVLDKAMGIAINEISEKPN